MKLTPSLGKVTSLILSHTTLSERWLTPRTKLIFCPKSQLDKHRNIFIWCAQWCEAECLPRFKPSAQWSQCIFCTRRKSTFSVFFSWVLSFLRMEKVVREDSRRKSMFSVFFPWVLSFLRMEKVVREDSPLLLAKVPHEDSFILSARYRGP